MWMRDGQLQALLPYSSDRDQKNRDHPDDDPVFTNIQSLVHPTVENSLTELGGYLPEVFRYFLAWFGDAAKVQKLIEKTVDLCRRQIDGFKRSQMPAEVWLLKIARHIRRTTRTRTLADRASLLDDDASSLEDLARLASFSEKLSGLPSREAEALVLTLFSGLSHLDAAKVLGVKEKKVNFLIESGLRHIQDKAAAAQERGGSILENRDAQLAASITRLAQAFQPDSNWLEGIQKRLSFDQAKSKAVSTDLRIDLSHIWRLVLKFLQIWGFRLLAIFLISSLVLGWWLKYLEPAKELPPAAAAVTEGLTREVVTHTPSTGYLVPPDHKICQKWQDILTDNLSGEISLQPTVSYIEPLSQMLEEETRGTACQILLVNNQATLLTSEVVFQSTLTLLQQEGFQISAECFNRTGGCNPYDYRALLQTGSLRAMLLGSTTELQEDQKQFRQWLQIASNPIQSVVEKFFNAWMGGNLSAMNSLSPDLRGSVSNIQALDRRVGILRRPSDHMDLEWNAVENSGDRLRLAVQATVNGGLPILFQVIVSQANSQWQVSELSPGVIFPVSVDSVYWAQQDGAIYSYSLENGKTYRLTSSGVYNPRGDYGSQLTVGISPEISPNGHWLVLYPPEASTLVIDLFNGNVTHLPETGPLAWDPYGKQVAFVENGSPGKIFKPILLAELAEDILALAFSPSRSQLAVLTEPPGSPGSISMLNPTQIQPGNLTRPRSIFIADIANGSTRRLAVFDCLADLAANPSDLVWTSDGNQIWYRSLRLAANLQDGALLPLLTGFVSPGPMDIRYAMIYPKAIPSGSTGNPAIAAYLISPDGKWKTYNPFWMAHHHVSTISLSDAWSFMDEEVWEADMQAKIYSLAFTQDSQNLIAGGQEFKPGPVFRINVQTGENQQLVNGVFWIGVGSELKSRSIALAPVGNIKLAKDDQELKWSCMEDLAFSCFQYPKDWVFNYLSPGNGEASLPLYLTNLVDPSYPGWVGTTTPGMIWIEFHDVYGPGEDIPEFLFEPYPSSQKGLSWEPFTIEGVDGVHILTPITGQSRRNRSDPANNS